MENNQLSQQLIFVVKDCVCLTVQWVEAHQMRSGRFRLPGKKHLVQGFGRPTVVVIDVTETPIERPQHRQHLFYSGKKKRHTLKCQVLINQHTGAVICLFFGKGSQHDFKLFQASGAHLHPDTEGLQDKGYQGIRKVASQQAVAHPEPQGRNPQPSSQR